MSFYIHIHCERASPGGSDSKESACKAGDLGSLSGSGRCPVEGNDYSLHFSCLENSTDRGAWRAAVHGVTKSRTGLRDIITHTTHQTATPQAPSTLPHTDLVIKCPTLAPNVFCYSSLFFLNIFSIAWYSCGCSMAAPCFLRK